MDPLQYYPSAALPYLIQKIRALEEQKRLLEQQVRQLHEFGRHFSAQLITNQIKQDLANSVFYLKNAEKVQYFDLSTPF